MFNERQKLILQAIIHDYISTAEPVGSRTIARKYNLGVSPATIRNEMYELEEAGYLEQPHTSAGRIPSDLGYRFYVDVLMEPAVIPEEQAGSVRAGLSLSGQEINRLLHSAVQLLSAMTQYTSVMIAPLQSKRIFKNLGLISMDDHHAFAVLVTEPNFIENATVQMSTPLSHTELTQLGIELSTILRGKDLSEINPSLYQAAKSLIPDRVLAEDLLEVLFGRRSAKGDQVLIEGTAHMLDHPEFMDINKVKSLLRAVETKGILLDVLSEDAKTSGLKVRIGKENRVDEFQECSLVTATYEYNGEIIGTIGVFGPTRLDYAKATATVAFFAEVLSELLEDTV